MRRAQKRETENHRPHKTQTKLPKTTVNVGCGYKCGVHEKSRRKSRVIVRAKKLMLGGLTQSLLSALSDAG
jgi:hypothetical protein